MSFFKNTQNNVCKYSIYKSACLKILQMYSDEIVWRTPGLSEAYSDAEENKLPTKIHVRPGPSNASHTLPAAHSLPVHLQVASGLPLQNMKCVAVPLPAPSLVPHQNHSSFLPSRDQISDVTKVLKPVRIQM